MQQNESLVEVLNKVIAVYRELQWSKEVVVGDVHYNYCPLCDQPEGKGHAASCLCTELNEILLAYGKSVLDELCEEKK